MIRLGGERVGGEKGEIGGCQGRGERVVRGAEARAATLAGVLGRRVGGREKREGGHPEKLERLVKWQELVLHCFVVNVFPERTKRGGAAGKARIGTRLQDKHVACVDGESVRGQDLGCGFVTEGGEARERFGVVDDKGGGESVWVFGEWSWKAL